MLQTNVCLIIMELEIGLDLCPERTGESLIELVKELLFKIFISALSLLLFLREVSTTEQLLRRNNAKL